MTDALTQAALPDLPDLERRAATRYGARGVALVRPEGPAKGTARPVRVLNISRGGICLLVSVEYPRRARLTLAPLGWLSPAPLYSLQVIHTRRADGYWIHGCKFSSKLSHQDLRDWQVTWGGRGSA
jgi:hypothetical protein